ncbi:MAG: NADH-quinone oxidoreductase subunit A [Anaerolineae bacterium]
MTIPFVSYYTKGAAFPRPATGSRPIKDADTMPIEYIPVLVLFVLATAIAIIALALPPFLGPRRPSPAKLAPYESGKVPYGDARRKVPIRYYKVALLFVIFDLEVVFFYPWAIVLRQLRLFGLIEMAIFTALLVIGYLYEWKKGGFEME